MSGHDFSQIPRSLFDSLSPKFFGVISGVEGPRLLVSGLNGFARVGDRLEVKRQVGAPLHAEILGLERDRLAAYAFGSTHGIAVGDRVELRAKAAIVHPSADWLGRVLNWRGEEIGGVAPGGGERPMRLDAAPPPAQLRKQIGARLETGLAAFDTFFPICCGQRIGVFAGSGVGKSTLLSDLAKGVNADVCVIALIGERGREVRTFVEAARENRFLERSVIVASTSDEPALIRRESAFLALAVAEYFRREGRQVLLIFDSLTRYAEAYREFALARGEPPSLHAYPPSTVSALASLVERAGPGVEGEGDVTAVFSVLVAGSDMDEPVADMVRGLLDGHIVLDRAIAERGRFPAINVRRSVSRSLPKAATEEENALLRDARALLSAYESSELVIRAGLYETGSDVTIDRAIALWPSLDAFVGLNGVTTSQESFSRLRTILDGA